MTLDSDPKFEEKLTCGLESNMRNLANFHQSTWKLGLKIGTFMGYFYPKWKMYELEIHRGVKCYGNEDRQNLKRNWLVQNWHELWSEHSKILKSLKNLHFDWSFLVIFDLKKYRGVIFHDTREWCKIWRKTNLNLRFGK